jgi:hypothetical protein
MGLLTKLLWLYPSDWQSPAPDKAPGRKNGGPCKGRRSLTAAPTGLEPATLGSCSTKYKRAHIPTTRNLVTRGNVVHPLNVT